MTDRERSFPEQRENFPTGRKKFGERTAVYDEKTDWSHIGFGTDRGFVCRYHCSGLFRQPFGQKLSDGGFVLYHCGSGSDLWLFDDFEDCKTKGQVTDISSPKASAAPAAALAFPL